MQEQNKHMHIIDDELYFVIEEKNNVIELTEKGIDLITGALMTRSSFILPDMGAEMAELRNKPFLKRRNWKRKMNCSVISQPNQKEFIPLTSLLKAYSLFEKDTEYVIMDNKVKDC
jgi:preprotein translocase subunit SecA